MMDYLIKGGILTLLILLILYLLDFNISSLLSFFDTKERTKDEPFDRTMTDDTRNAINKVLNSDTDEDDIIDE